MSPFRSSFAALALLAIGCRPAPRPNNLLILCVDTLRADELGAYGASPSCTPGLDRLAEASVVFERAHAAASWTLPSVGALFTAHVPSTTNLWTFESRLSDGFTTLAERFRAGGFETHGIASHIFFARDYGLQQGFETFDDELCHRTGEQGWKPVTSPEVAAKATRWLEGHEKSTRPWLLFVHFFDPHLQYLDHEAQRLDDLRRPERERYRSEIAFTDRHVGRVLETLAHVGLEANTNVLFFSDHGESFLEHAPIQRHSYSLYEEELHVPLILAVPGIAARRVPDFVGVVDVLSTVLELAGLARAEPAEGESLVPLLSGATREGAPLLAEIRLKDGFHANALLRGRYKLIEDVSGDRLLLFDLLEDPREQHDLAASEPALAAALRSELRTRTQAAEEAGARFGPAGTVEHTPEELEHIKALGYGGEDEPK